MAPIIRGSSSSAKSAAAEPVSMGGLLDLLCGDKTGEGFRVRGALARVNTTIGREALPGRLHLRIRASGPAR